VSQIVAATPGVEAVAKHYASEVMYRGERIRVSAITTSVIEARIGFDLTEQVGSEQDVARGLGAGGVIVYEAFRRHFGVSPGDTITLDTPRGKQSFPVVGVETAYVTGKTGGIQMDLETFDRYWSRPGYLNLIVWTTAPQDHVLDDIQRRVGSAQPLFFLPAQQADRIAQVVLGQYVGLIYGLLGIVVALAGAAVVNLLVG